MTTLGIVKRCQEQPVGRIAFEHGADMIKSRYTSDLRGFQRMTDDCPASILVASSPRMDPLEGSPRLVREAASVISGAAGVVFGRNVWQSGGARGTVRALRGVVHDGRPVTEALAEAGVT
ncbi:MAG: hypothetical protein ACR2JR_07805 [Rubrobacteraceae bacterium]